MKRMQKRIGIAGAFLAAVIVIFLSSKARGRAEHSDPSASSIRTVAVAVARRTPLSVGLTLSGEFKPFQDVDLHAKVAGYIHTISVDVGDHVRAGQVLAILEVPELVAQVQEADASLDHAKSAYQAMHLAYARLKQASDARPGLIAAQELEDSLARDREAEAQVAQAEARKRQVSVLSDYSRIVAPFAGVITRRYADTGALIQSGTSSSTQAMPVVRLAECDRLRLVLPVPESAVPRIRVGTVVKVVVPAIGRAFEGRVARLSDDLERQTRTMETEIDVVNSDGRLVAGMYAETVLDLVHEDSALTVPIQAVARNGSRATVRVVGPRNRVEERTVTIGMEGTRRLEVLSGLREGDRVLIGSRSEAGIGDEVRPRPIDEGPDEAGGGS